MNIEDLANLTVKSIGIGGPDEFPAIIFDANDHAGCMEVYATDRQSASELAIFMTKVLKAASKDFIEKEKMARQRNEFDPVNQMMDEIIQNRIRDEI